MTATVCLNCGFDLTPFEPIRRGDLFIPDRVTVEWQGKPIRLQAQQRLILLAVVRADGDIISRNALLEASGGESDCLNDPSNLVDVQLSRIRLAFRAADRMFDQLETVKGQGLRWRA